MKKIFLTLAIVILAGCSNEAEPTGTETQSFNSAQCSAENIITAKFPGKTKVELSSQIFIRWVNASGAVVFLDEYTVQEGSVSFQCQSSTDLNYIVTLLP